MTEPTPEIKKTLPVVELGISYAPFEYDSKLPEIEPTEVPGEFFSRKFALRGIDNGFVSFDSNPDTEILKKLDSVIITKDGVVFAHKGTKTAAEMGNKRLFSIAINFNNHKTEEQINWSISFPKFNFTATRFSPKVGELEFTEFKDQETGKEVVIFVPYDLEILKELKITFNKVENGK